MNMLKGLYFPGTTPDPKLFCRLLCLLDKVDFYQVVESGKGTGGDTDGVINWRGQVVAPLGADRARFLTMIHEIKGHAADFSGGFLAALSNDALADRGESSVWQLVANLHGKKKTPDQDPLLVEKLWQARLVLKLAEVLAEERAEIARALTEFGARELAVFDALKGEFDEQDECEEFFRENDLNLGLGQAAPQVRHLLKAWGTLFALDHREHSFLVTECEACAATLFDAWEELTAGRPQLLVELELPARESVAAMETARKTMAGARMATVDALKAIVGRQPAGLANLTKAAELWQAEVAGDEGRKRSLAIYLLRGPSLRTLWARLSGMAVAGDAGGTQHSLVGILGPSA